MATVPIYTSDSHLRIAPVLTVAVTTFIYTQTSNSIVNAIFCIHLSTKPEHTSRRFQSPYELGDRAMHQDGE